MKPARPDDPQLSLTRRSPLRVNLADTMF